MEVPSPINIAEGDIRNALDANVRTHVRVSGINDIDPRIIAKDLEAIKRCTTIAEIARIMSHFQMRWTNIGIFQTVNYNLEPTQDGTANDICVQIDVQEAKPKKSIGVFTTDTALPEVTLAFENVLGGRYSIKGNYIPPASRVHSLSFSLLSNAPFFGQTAEYYIGRRNESKFYHPASTECIEEIKATARDQKAGVDSVFSLGFQRRVLIAKDKRNFPVDILPDFGTTGKGYARHELSYTNVAYHANPYLYNMYPLPIYGTQMNATTEFAGGPFGGDFTYLKSELQGTRYWPLGAFFSLQWSAKIAGIYPFMQNRIPLNDRLFLSNCHVRGFKSVGPSTLDHGNAPRFAATGGNALWATSLNLNFPFLFFPNNGLASMHLFANAGHLRMVDTRSALCDWRTWLRDCACSVGAGIVVTRIPLLSVTSSGRFELNFAVPVGIDKGGDIVWRNGTKHLFSKIRFGLVWSSNLSS